MATAVILTVVGLIAVAATGRVSSGAVQEHHQKVSAKAPAQCPSHKRGLQFYRGRYVEWRDVRGVETAVPVGRDPQSCADALYLAHVWADRSHQQRQVTERWLDQRTLHDFAVSDGNNAWLRAVHEAQRAYPGTEAWLLSCSASEGGHGRWVANSQGSGAGGWMQMMHGTWSTMFYGWYGDPGALASLKARGFIVPRSAQSWYSPLGQALAAAHGKTHGRGSEWYGGGCG